MTPIESWEKIRTDAITEMFDNVDAYGIYPTSKFFKTIDKYFYEKLDEAYRKGREDAVEYVMAQDIWHKLRHDDFYELRGVLREARHAGEVTTQGTGIKASEARDGRTY